MRPRQSLEIRYLDSVPGDIWPAMVFTLVTLLDDPVAAALRPRRSTGGPAWDPAARTGLATRVSRRGQRAGLAAEHAPAGLAERCGALPMRWRGRCPADDFADRVIEHGIAAT